MLNAKKSGEDNVRPVKNGLSKQPSAICSSPGALDAHSINPRLLSSVLSCIYVSACDPFMGGHINPKYAGSCIFMLEECYALRSNKLGA